MKSNNAMNLKMNRKAKGKMYQLTVSSWPLPNLTPITFPKSFSFLPFFTVPQCPPSISFPLPRCPGVKQVRRHAVCVACLQDNIWHLCGMTSFFTRHFFLCFSLIWKKDNEVVSRPLCKDREKQWEKHVLVLASEASHIHQQQVLLTKPATSLWQRAAASQLKPCGFLILPELELWLGLVKR